MFSQLEGITNMTTMDIKYKTSNNFAIILLKFPTLCWPPNMLSYLFIIHELNLEDMCHFIIISGEYVF